VLARELSELLVELSIGVHRYAMYPAGHPSLTPVVENILGRLVGIFGARRTLSIGVAQRQLVIEGVATDQRHPVLSDLARRLHDHQLSALSFEKGVRAAEVSELLTALAGETERGGTPLGLLPPGEAPHWDHATLYRVGYDRLEIKDAEGGAGTTRDERATALWIGLARAALASEEPLDAVPDAPEIARRISEHLRESAYDQVIVGYMLQLTEELREARGRESEKVRQGLSRLITELDDGTLARLVDFGGDAAQRRRFLLDANDSLAVDSVVKVLSAAAKSPEQSISHSMMRLLTKLANHAEHGRGARRAQADTALRENVETLLSGWELEDPNPEAYTNVLNAIARSAPIFEGREGEEDPLAGAERLVQMGIELDTWGPTVAKAVLDLADGGGIGMLLDMLRDVPTGNDVADRIRHHLTDPEQFRRLLTGGHLDDAALKSLVGEMGDGAIDPLLDVLAESDERSVRRRVFDTLTRMGPLVGRRTVERLQTDGRWLVARNMLALLCRLRHVPEDFDPQPFVEHADPRVRREAFPLALRKPALRDRALVGSFMHGDERLVRMALLELQDDVPPPVLPTLVNRVVTNPERSGEIRALAIKALRHSRSTLVLNALVGMVGAGRSLFGKARLAPASLEMAQALRVLAEHWSDRPEAKEVLQQAARSKDPYIRAAVYREADG